MPGWTPARCNKASDVGRMTRMQVRRRSRPSTPPRRMYSELLLASGKSVAASSEVTKLGETGTGLICAIFLCSHRVNHAVRGCPSFTPVPLLPPLLSPIGPMYWIWRRRRPDGTILSIGLGRYSRTPVQHRDLGARQLSGDRKRCAKRWRVSIPIWFCMGWTPTTGLSVETFSRRT